MCKIQTSSNLRGQCLPILTDFESASGIWSSHWICRDEGGSRYFRDPQTMEGWRSVFSCPQLLSSTLVLEYTSASAVKTGLVADYYPSTCSRYCIHVYMYTWNPLYFTISEGTERNNLLLIIFLWKEISLQNISHVSHLHTISFFFSIFFFFSKHVPHLVGECLGKK